MVTYSNDSNTYALTVSELLSWDYRTYRFGTSYSYYYCEPTSEMPNRLANGNRGLVLDPDSPLNDEKRALLQTHFFTPSGPDRYPSSMNEQQALGSLARPPKPAGE